MPEDLSFQLLTDKPFSLPGVFFKQYKALGLTDIQFLMLMHIRQFHEEGNEFPTPDQLVERMTMDSAQVTRELKWLLSNRFITIVDQNGEDSKITETISIEPLFEKLHLFLNEAEQTETKTVKKQQEGSMFQRFEQEFARPLSPMEMEMISMWLDDDGHAVHLIEAALREAVVSSRLNFRYIDRILFDWKKNNITTVEQAKRHGEKVRSHQPSRNSSKKSEKKPEKRHPGYNWLEGEDK